MHQSVRINTFETNSSSMHSLVVVKDPKPYKEDELLSAHGNKRFDLFWCDEGTYERFPFRVMRTPLDKLRYYVAHYIGACKQLELVPKVIDFIANQLHIPKDNITINVDEDDDEDENEEKELNYGYAGINDTGENVFTYIEDNNISMEEFVLNPKYVVIIDGDEYQEFKKLFESNILDANNFEYISSGPDFWNESIFEISLYWLENNTESWGLLSLINDISKFTKSVQLDVYEDTINLYDKNFDELKLFFDTVKTKFPDMEFNIKIQKDKWDKIKAKDLSIFNYAVLTDTEYGPIIEKIKIY